jgi:transposase
MRRRSKKRSRKTPFLLCKPRGKLNDRVQAVGPEHFGVVCIDPAKSCSCYMLADFYGNVLLEPTDLPHTRGNLQAAIDGIRQAQQQHDLRDMVVAIEMTGEYHRPVQRAFRQAWEVRIVHPLTSRNFRQPANPENKTDENDLGGIFRAAINGFGLSETVWPTDYQDLQILSRHRRSLVRKRSTVRTQLGEAIHKAMPGYTKQFDDDHFWRSQVPLTVARQTGSAQAIQQAGIEGLAQILTAHQHCRGTLHKILAWADAAPEGNPRTELYRHIIGNLHDDFLAKTQQIVALERQMAHLLAGTPYILLLVIPGIGVVSASDLAAELGPIEHYANANCITGRAALMPSRYQSDQVDCNGSLRHCGNRRLRFALLQIADNLVLNNNYFRARAAIWATTGKTSAQLRIKVAKSFSRIAFAMVAGRQLLNHPCCQQRHYILQKLLTFHRDTDTPMPLARETLDKAIGQLPRSAYAREAKPLQEQLRDLERRQRGVQPLRTILPIVLARLGLSQVQSEPAGEPDLS